jgi:hypothetical protein
MTHPFSNRSLLRSLVILLLAVTCSFPSQMVMAQQGTTTRYTYDENGRLKSVILPTGEAAVYNYDAAGNITSIQRIAVNGLALQDFSPREGAIGDQVTFTGVGFGATIAENTVKFNNNVTATIISANSTQIIAEVPQGAVTGIVTITTPLGTVTTAQPFTVVGKLQVKPALVEVEPTRSMQFTTVFTSYTGDQSVTWKVNDITGGNSTVGTINANGLYTAPAFSSTQASLSVVIKAVSVAVPAMSGESEVTVKYKLIATSAAAVSIKRGSTSGPLRSGAVSVQFGPSPRTAATLPPAVSIQYGPSPRTAATLPPKVSVQYGPRPRNAPAQATGVSVTNGPIISSISTASISRGTTVSLTINGTNLTGATNLRFITTASAVDSSITIANLSVNSEGTSLTVNVTVSSQSALGKRVVVVVAGTLRSQIADVSTNSIEVVQ